MHKARHVLGGAEAEQQNQAAQLSSTQLPCAVRWGGTARKLRRNKILAYYWIQDFLSATLKRGRTFQLYGVRDIMHVPEKPMISCPVFQSRSYLAQLLPARAVRRRHVGD